MAEETGEAALFFRGHTALGNGGREFRIQGDVDALAAGRFGHRTDGKLLFFLLFITGTLAVTLVHRLQHRPQGHRKQQHQQRGKEDHRGDLGKDCHGPFADGAGNDAAGGNGLTAFPKCGNHSVQAEVALLAKEHMGKNAQDHGAEQGAGKAQLHRLSVVADQDDATKAHGGGGQIVSVAKKALEKACQGVQENGADAEIAHQGAQGQHQQNDAPDLPAHRLFSGGLWGAAALCPGGLGGRCSFFRCGFLLCHDSPSLAADNGHDQGQRANSPAVVGKSAELALGGDHFQQTDAGVAGQGRNRHTH